MDTTLFSAYRQGENRVTGSTLSVFERIDFSLVAEILARASGVAEDDLGGVNFTNQPRGREGTPDGRISGGFDWWLETKIVRGYYDKEDAHGPRDQIRRHSELLTSPGSRLFVLTPDTSEPEWLKAPTSVAEGTADRIHWIGFAALADAINGSGGNGQPSPAGILRDPDRFIGEHTRFLLNELIDLYRYEGLLEPDEDTAVVAAGNAWNEYLRFGAYICAPNRPFRRGLTHLAFYTGKQIKPLVPAILTWSGEQAAAGDRAFIPELTVSSEEANRIRSEGQSRLADLVEALLKAGSREEGDAVAAFLLSKEAEAETVKLDGPVAHVGRGAWTQSQRYTSLRLLQVAETTADLVKH